MTKLTKPVHRETNKYFGKRAVVVTLAPAGSQEEALIGLRLKGQRTQYVCTLSDVYRMAAFNHGVKAAAAKRLAKKNGVPWSRVKKQFNKENSIESDKCREYVKAQDQRRKEKHDDYPSWTNKPK